MINKFIDFAEFGEEDFCAEAAIRSGLPEELDSELKNRPKSSKYNNRPNPKGVNLQNAMEAANFQIFCQKWTRDEYKKIISGIEKLADQALSSSEVPIAFKGYLSFDLTKLAKELFAYFPVMVEVAGKFSNQNRYDEYIELFRATCAQLGLYDNQLIRQSCFWEAPERKPQSAVMHDCAQIFNAFVETLRRLGKENGVRQRRTERLRDAKERYNEYRKYFEKLVIQYRRLVVVRLDLAYRVPLRVHTMSRIGENFDTFLRNRRSNQTVFAGLVGYIAKFEYGVDRGPHIHLIVFFDGDKRRDHRSHFAESIGEYWEKITQGRGSYFNCHANDSVHAQRGTLSVGLIQEHDDKMREKFCKHVLAYVCKSDSFARPIDVLGFRAIRRGVLPKKPCVKKKSKA